MSEQMTAEDLARILGIDLSKAINVRVIQPGEIVIDRERLRETLRKHLFGYDLINTLEKDIFGSDGK